MRKQRLFPQESFAGLSKRNSRTFFSHYKKKRKLLQQRTTVTHSVHSNESHADYSLKRMTSLTAEDEKEMWKNEYIPSYLNNIYWWAYIHPRAVQFWDRKPLVGGILWGNFNLLRDEALNEITKNVNHLKSRQELNVSQIACVYGDFSNHLLNDLTSICKTYQISTRLNIIDIAPIQLNNTHQKLKSQIEQTSHLPIHVQFSQQNSAHLKLDDCSMDYVYSFFLLHEQPEDIRIQTIRETLRILKNNGSVIFVDYHQPISAWNPMRYVMKPILTYIEPYAIDLWKNDIMDYVQDELNDDPHHIYHMSKQTFFGGLYQKVVVTKRVKSATIV